ncbi:MAG: glycoside hydrolase family 3 C-terminal domain-containing protein, partial [Promicromonosporaceae bacterium]|nr:glycoside hydrolase family 3 C-terminal domain-containing protein [Promicromonosporaceae bacterium]
WQLEYLRKVKEAGKPVILVLTGGSPIAVPEDIADVIIFSWYSGEQGGRALADIIFGDTVPSGKLPLTFPASTSQLPPYDDYSMKGRTYRYMTEKPLWPFGFGLSYTDFEWEIISSEVGDITGEIEITVRVHNTGSVPGRDVVQLYHTAPWDPALNIEVAHVVLRGFAKTDTIAPGGFEDVTITVPVEDLASYDHRDSRAWVMLPGLHELTVRTNSNTIAEGTAPVTFNQVGMHVFEGENARSTDQIPATNLFDDVSDMFTQTPAEGRVLELSRRDFAGTFPTAPSPDLFIANDSIIEGFAPWDYEARAARFDGVRPATGVRSDLTLADVRGLPFDHPLWEELLDSLTVSEMIDLLAFGAYRTAPIASIAKPETIDVDGPAGFSSFISEAVQGVAYPSQALIAQTWDVDIARAQGRMMGNEALFLGVSGWYAPGLNLHRSPFGGRNFEYYSEDPFLSGILANEVSSGLGEFGVYTMIKHFAVNEQEMNRKTNGLANWLTEQALREVYLPAFEIPIKNSTFEVPFLVNGEIETVTKGAMGVMSAFTRIGAEWTGGDPRLMQTILRDEWGFEGFVISDFNLYPYMSPNQSIYAGTDLTLSLVGRTFEDTSSAAAVHDMRQATHRVLFGVANSNAMNGIAPGAVGNFTPPTWMVIQWVATAAMGVLILGGTLLVIRRVRKFNATPETFDGEAIDPIDAELDAMLAEGASTPELVDIH